MIGQLTGLIGQIEADRCIVDVHGVGYVVYASTRTLVGFGDAANPVRLFIETIVREDAINLYGFQTSEDRAWFRLLTTVPGVGAKVGLAILSVLTSSELTACIQSGDKTALTRASGVGGRLAERIVNEMKTKVASFAPGIEAGVIASGKPAQDVPSDVMQALLQLGFRRAEAWPIVRKIYDERQDGDVDGLIRAALKALGR